MQTSTEHFFDIPSAYSSPRTLQGIFSGQEKNSTMLVTVGGMAYDVVMWGFDNQKPYKMKRAVENNSVMSQNKHFNVLTCYGRGLEYMDLSTRKDKRPQPTGEPDITKFLMKNSMKRFFAEQATDIKMYNFCVAVVILNRGRDKIVRVVHKDACHVRFEVPDAYGRVNHILYADWQDNNSPEQVEVVPVLAENDPLCDLLARTGKEKDVLNEFHRSPVSETKFAIICRMPNLANDLYPTPPWMGALNDGWYDIYNFLTKAKLAKIKNGQNIRYHVEINTDFWKARAQEKGVQINTPEYVKMKSDFIDQLKDHLSGSKNSDKLIWSEFDSLLSGDERHYIKINVVDTSKAGSEYNDDVAEAANVLCYDDNVHPNLAGASPGKSQMNNSGSDKRELFTMKQALETMPHDMMMVLHNTIIHFNDWADKVYPDVPMILLTTLDKNTDAVQVSTNNKGQAYGTEK